MYKVNKLYKGIMVFPGDGSDGDGKPNEGSGKEGEGNKGGNEDVNKRLDSIEKKLDGGIKLSSDDQALIDLLLKDDEEHGSKGKESEPKNVNFDDMSRAELVDYIVKAVQSEVGSISKKLDDKISSTNKSVVEQQVAQEIAAARKKYGKDFDDNIDAISKVADKYPDLSAEEAYILATSGKLQGSLSETKKKLKSLQDRDSNIAGKSLGASINNASVIDGIEAKSHREAAMEIIARLRNQEGA